jgi:hypothetical protein
MKDNSDKRIENILNSSGLLTPTEAPPFFYSKLRTRMDRLEEPAFVLRKPAFAIAALSFFVVMNILMLIRDNRSQKNTDENKITLESFVSNYSLDNSWNN